MHELAEWEGNGHDEAVDTVSLQHGALIVPQQATLSLSLFTRHDEAHLGRRTGAAASSRPDDQLVEILVTWVVVQQCCAASLESQTQSYCNYTTNMVRSRSLSNQR